MSKPFTILKLDKDYEFRLSNKAGYFYEELTGKSMMDFGNKFGLVEMNSLVYAGLKCINKDITLFEVIELIDHHTDIETLSKILEKAMEQSTFFKLAKN